MTRPRSAPLGTGSHSYSTASTSSYLGAQLLMRLETSAAEKIGGHSALARRQSTILSTEHQDLDVLHFIKNTHTGPPSLFQAFRVEDIKLHLLCLFSRRHVSGPLVG